MFGSIRGDFLVVAILPLMITTTRFNWNITCGHVMGCSLLGTRLMWFIFSLLTNTILMCFYIMALDYEKDGIAWASVFGYAHVVWTVVHFASSFYDWDYPFVISAYVFGSVGVVLISAVALMTELILKTVNGEGPMGDLRTVVFISESLFIIFLLILIVFEPWIKARQRLHQDLNTQTQELLNLSIAMDVALMNRILKTCPHLSGKLWSS
nr:uncharacterized protein LOC129436714 [Misgurnus anguillicaudatus]